MPRTRAIRIAVTNLLLAIVAPLVLLAGCELVLRAVGYGHSYALLEPCTLQGVTGWRGNQRFTWRFFPPALGRTIEPFFAADQKASNAWRVIVLGSSAAQGVPDPSYSLARLVQVMLRAQCPARAIEVINLGITAINSHAVRVMALECMRLQPDALVVYMGNNEVVGPYGAGSVFGKRGAGRWRIRLEVWLRGTRTGQLLAALGGGRRAAAGWRGMEAFMQQRVAYADPALERVYEHLRANLDEICHTATRAQVPLVLCTVGSNLGDCPPFGFDLSTRDNAQEYFDRGALLLARGSNSAARAAFVAARDRDLLRFRADSRINAIIRERAAHWAAHGVMVCDIEEALAAASTTGIAGAESFYEHVHLTFGGAYSAAAQISHALAGCRAGGADGGTCSQDDCARQLAFTPWDEVRVLRDVEITYLAKPPFTAQHGHAERVAAHAARVAARTRTLTPAVLDAAEAGYRAALAQDTHDWQLWYNYAQFLLHARQDAAGAIAQLQRAAQCMPHAFAAHDSLGKLYLRLNRPGEAWAAFDAARALLPHSATIENNLGVARLQQGDMRAAMAHFQRALHYEPDNAASYNNLAVAAMQLGERSNAVMHLRTALQHDPHNAQTHCNLAILLVQGGELDAARAHYEAVLRCDAHHETALTHLGALHVREGRAQEAVPLLTRALALNPQNADARRALEAAHATLHLSTSTATNRAPARK